MPEGIGYGPGVMGGGQGNQAGGRARKRSPFQQPSPMTPPPGAPGPFQPLPSASPDQLARPVPRSPLPLGGMTQGPGIEELLMMLLQGGQGA